MVSVITLGGMIAVHSRRAVFTALAGVDGVRRAEVEWGRAVIVHEDSVLDASLVEAIESVGCTVTSIERVARRELPIQQHPRDGP